MKLYHTKALPSWPTPHNFSQRPQAKLFEVGSQVAELYLLLQQLYLLEYLPSLCFIFLRLYHSESFMILCHTEALRSRATPDNYSLRPQAKWFKVGSQVAEIYLPLQLLYLSESLPSSVFVILKLYLSEALSFWSFIFLKVYLSEAWPSWSFIILNLPLSSVILKLYLPDLPPINLVYDCKLSCSRPVVRSLSFTYLCCSFIFLNLYLPESLSTWTFIFLKLYLFEALPF